MSKKIQPSKLGIRLPDFLFICLVLANLALVGYLGFGDYQRGRLVADSQQNGEQILVWFEDLALKLQDGSTISPQSCIPFSEEVPGQKGAKINTWKSCVEALYGSNGPFHQYTNLLIPSAPAYAANCDKHELDSSGAFIFEKLTANPAGPPSAGPMESGEKLLEGINIRLSLCDTGYYLIKIGEFKL